MAMLQGLLAAVLCGRVQTHLQKSKPIIFEIVGFDACLLRAPEWQKLDAAYTAGIAELAGLPKDRIKDVEGRAGHVSIVATNFTLQVPVPGHLVSFFVDQEGDVNGELMTKLWAKDFREGVMQILAPSPPELHRLALATRTLEACDLDGDGELSFEEFQKVLKQHDVLGMHAQGEELSTSEFREAMAKYGGPIGFLANLPGYTLPALACLLGVAEKPAAAAIECGALDRLNLGDEGRVMVSNPMTSITKQVDTADQVQALRTNSKDCHPFDWQSMHFGRVGSDRKFSLWHPQAKAKLDPLGKILAGASVLGSTLVAAAMISRWRPRAHEARTPSSGPTVHDAAEVELLAEA